MTIQEAQKHYENSIVVYYNDAPFKIEEMRKNNRVLLVSTMDSRKKKQIAIKNLVSSVDLNASGFEKKPEKEKVQTPMQRLANARKKLASNPTDTKPIREELSQWDFVSSSVFVGLYMDVFREIPSSDPKKPPFKVYGFRSISDGNAYGLGGYAINEAIENDLIHKGRFYQVEFLGKTERTGSKNAFNRFNIYEIPEDLHDDFMEMLKTVPGVIEQDEPF
ncbi:MAG: hypothetical protein ACW972_02045 [Promethearchaeota archaeon]